MNVQELLDRPGIKEFLETHQGAAKEIWRAAEILVNQPDACPALKSLLPALSEKKIFIFFSYKKKDETAAKTIVDLLRRRAAGKLKITYQASFTTDIVGERWREKISKEVRRANWFILLLPDPSYDWDWCLFETGFFDRRHTSAHRLICLHHPDTGIPDPIKDYHAVAASSPEVEKFLRMVFLEDNPVPGMEAINPDVEPEIPELARKIVEAIQSPQKSLTRKIYEPWVELKIQNPAGLNDKDELDKALVKSANRRALDLFGFLRNQPTWGKLRSGLPENPDDDRWREELFHVIRKIAKGRKFFPVQAVFQTADSKFYRPIACAVDTAGPDGPIEIFHITFAEEVTHFDISSMPEELSRLALILRFTFRFRWEVLEKFAKGSIKVEDVERLDNSLRRIKVDAESRGITGEAFMVAVNKLFSTEEAKRISEMLGDWYQVRNPSGMGELDIAIEKQDTEKIPKILARFIPVNQEFLEMAADRFSKLVSGKQH